MSTQRKWMYKALLLTVFLNGWYVASYGPLIPFFSEATGLDQTHYSYLFLVRSIANIAGAMTAKYMLKVYKTRNVMNLNLAVVSISMFLCTFSLSTSNLTITLFLTSSSLVSSVVIIYDVTFRLFLHEQPDYWVQLIGFIFGAGAMFGPILVAIFRLYTFAALAAFQFLALLILLKYPIPDFANEASPKFHNQTTTRPPISSRTVMFIFLIFFFYATEELGMGSWISTYSIKTGIADVQSSAFYSMLFWVPNCLGRLLWMYIPGKIEQRLGLALKTVLITMTFTVFFQYCGWYKLVCIFAPLTTGIFIAGVYGFCMALPVDNGFITTPQDNANFILGNSFGEGLLIMPLGYSMHVFDPNALMILILFFSGLSYWCFLQSVKSMHTDREKYEAGLLKDKEMM